jgi:hypothetical protein
MTERRGCFPEAVVRDAPSSPFTMTDPSAQQHQVNTILPSIARCICLYIGIHSHILVSPRIPWDIKVPMLVGYFLPPTLYPEPLCQHICYQIVVRHDLAA